MTKPFRDVAVTVMRQSDEMVEAVVLVKKVKWDGLAVELAVEAMGRELELSPAMVRATRLLIPSPRIITLNTARAQVTAHERLFGLQGMAHQKGRVPK